MSFSFTYEFQSIIMSRTSDVAPASSKEYLDIQANDQVWIHSETSTWHDNNIQSNIRSLLCRIFGYTSMIQFPGLFYSCRVT